MELDRKALYNSLYMHFRDDPNFTSVEPWAVLDYRSLPLETLFQRLENQHISLDKTRFLAYAEDVESPEELFETLVDEEESDETEQDEIYLLLFELYRRLLPERRPLTIFCDELDHLIDAYDRGTLRSNEPLEDALASLDQIVKENLEEDQERVKEEVLNGDRSPMEIFSFISSCCANDIESFLCDFIYEEIDAGNLPYASELIEDFEKYVLDKKWFTFLETYLASKTKREDIELLNQKLLKEVSKSEDIDFVFVALTYFSQNGPQESFSSLAVKKLPLLKSEQDFKDLLSLSENFLAFLDKEEDENEVVSILERRSQIDPEASFDPKNPDSEELILILKRLF